MSYFTPYIDAAGIHLPTYADILNKRIADAQAIYGTDIYLANDSQDYQYISAEAYMLNDAMQLCQLAYNNASITNAKGVAVDSLIKLNGLTRKKATYSTCIVALKGTAGTVIAAGVAVDTAGYKWDLPLNTTIGSDGTVTVTATCETAGVITAAIGTIQNISTLQNGWSLVYNPVAAIPGIAIETDSKAKLRQSNSVSITAQTPISSTLAAILDIDGVTRAYVYENKTAATDANGILAHSIAAIVEGGADSDVAQAIAKGKTEGCDTYGTTSVTLSSSYSISSTINFSRPTYDVIGVNITVLPLTGYNQTIQNQIIANVQDYINSLAIGSPVQASSLYYPALNAMAQLSNQSFAITALAINENGGDFGSSAGVAWNAVAEAGRITITGGY